MSWQSLLKSTAIHIIIGIVLTLVIFGGGVWVGRTTHTCPQIDTLFVTKTDTVYITKLEQIKAINIDEDRRFKLYDHIRQLAVWRWFKTNEEALAFRNRKNTIVKNMN